MASAVGLGSGIQGVNNDLNLYAWDLLEREMGADLIRKIPIVSPEDLGWNFSAMEEQPLLPPIHPRLLSQYQSESILSEGGLRGSVIHAVRGLSPVGRPFIACTVTYRHVVDNAANGEEEAVEVLYPRSLLRFDSFSVGEMVNVARDELPVLRGSLLYAAVQNPLQVAGLSVYGYFKHLLEGVPIFHPTEQKETYSCVTVVTV